jgi:hypothetical protein
VFGIRAVRIRAECLEHRIDRITLRDLSETARLDLCWGHWVTDSPTAMVLELRRWPLSNRMAHICVRRRVFHSMIESNIEHPEAEPVVAEPVVA